MFATVLSYLAVFGSAALLAGVLAVIVYFITKRRFSKFWVYFGCVVAVLVVFASTSQKPMIFYEKTCEQMLSEEQEDAIKAVSAGAYSTRCPFIPLMVRATEVREDYAAWTQYYFPFGTMEMELTGADGYNCVKPLF